MEKYTSIVIIIACGLIGVFSGLFIKRIEKNNEKIIVGTVANGL